MSHFAVMVIGPDPVKQLAPYHEYESTGVDNEYVQDVDITDRVLARINKTGQSLENILAYYNLSKCTVTSELNLDKQKEHRFGYAIVKGELIKAVKRTNLNAKWDWYQLGGRYRGFFRLKQDHKGLAAKLGWDVGKSISTPTDAALKCDIDFEAMRCAAEQRAATKWVQMREALSSLSLPTAWKTFMQSYENVEEARIAYADLPAVKALERANIYPWVANPAEYYRGTREDFIKRARDAAPVTFAVIKDGHWYERGKLGWWAVIEEDEKNSDTWNSEFNKLLDGVSDDTLLSIFNCHI